MGEVIHMFFANIVLLFVVPIVAGIIIFIRYTYPDLNKFDNND